MKRILVIFVAAVLAGTAIAATVTHFVSKEGGEPIGRRHMSFEVDGVRYVTSDRATMDKVEAVVKAHVERAPLARVGEEQFEKELNKELEKIFREAVKSGVARKR